jgi:hypothetical protein
MWGLQHTQSQPEHHRKMTSQVEFLPLLKKDGFAYDERYSRFIALSDGRVTGLA